MSFGHKASSIWPEVMWHGQSNIHVSRSFNACIQLGADQWALVLKIIAVDNTVARVWRHLQKTFPGFVWLITPEEFASILMVDCYRHLKGELDSESPNKLKNPDTGSVFHRIALLDESVVGGIRFWCDSTGDYTVFGWRFRIESQDENSGETRRRSREVVLEAEGHIEMVVDSFMNVKEPSKHHLYEFETMLVTLE